MELSSVLNIVRWHLFLLFFTFGKPPLLKSVIYSFDKNVEINTVQEYFIAISTRNEFQVI